MRYLVIAYYRRPNGQMDEVVSVAKRIRPRDLQSASVIMDFQTSRVIKCSLDGTVVPKDWQRIRDFYHQHYAQLIDDLEQAHDEKDHSH